MTGCRVRAGAVAGVLAAALALSALWPAAPAFGEQAQSQVRAMQAGHLSIGGAQTCAVLDTGLLRCWGPGGPYLGLGSPDGVGATNTPADVPPVDLGPGRTARAVDGGDDITCALLDAGQVRCWGLGFSGRLGLGNTDTVGATDTPADVPPVDLGPGRTAVAVSAGGAHACALLDTGDLRCWGFGADGRLGLGSPDSVGATNTPADVPPVDLGAGRAAVAVSAGGSHTCAILDTGQVRCWGAGLFGALGQGDTASIGIDDTPADNPAVDLGPGRTAVAISAGVEHTCAILDTGQVRCWGTGLNGRLGTGNTARIGDDETPGSVDPVDLGPGRTAVAISAGSIHTCAILDTGQVRCWGSGQGGRLGSGDTATVGAADTPAQAAPVDLGPGRTAVALSAGAAHTCATLDTGQVRCWGTGTGGRLGYASVADLGGTPDTVPSRIGGVELAGILAPRVADLSLASQVSTPSAQVGDTITLTHTITNGGPDTARPAVAVAPGGGMLALPAAPGAGSFDPAAGLWRVGPLAPGQSATLVLPVRVVAPGVLEAVTEIAASDAPDPDSTPANGVAGEDDRTIVSVEVPAPAPLVVEVPGPTVTVPGPTVTVPGPAVIVPGPTVTVPAPAVRVAPDRLVARLGAARSLRGPVRTRVTATLAITRAPLRSSCRGVVVIVARAGGRTVQTRRAPLRLVGTACRAIGTLSLPRARVRAAPALRVSARFAGNPLLTPRSAPVRSVRLR